MNGHDTFPPLYTHINSLLFYFSPLLLQQLLECERCRNCYHLACLGPNYPTKPFRKRKGWVSVGEEQELKEGCWLYPLGLVGLSPFD